MSEVDCFCLFVERLEQSRIQFDSRSCSNEYSPEETFKNIYFYRNCFKNFNFIKLKINLLLKK